MYALVGEECTFVVRSIGDGEPVKGTEGGCNVIVFPCPCYDPGCTVLYAL